MSLGHNNNYYYIFNCHWVDAQWQQYSTHVHTNSAQNTENGTYITIKIKVKIGKCGPCPVFASYTLVFALQLRKKHGKTSVRVVETCPGCQQKSERNFYLTTKTVLYCVHLLRYITVITSVLFHSCSFEGFIVSASTF
jgi:RNase P subunit RPR2